ncbi:MAG: substrate-binding domain-containing protein [Rickettsiaceae bacterium H1]|nr:substrate-binding domain-containing protein [Rickettsiaceae bacterium H1]
MAKVSLFLFFLIIASCFNSYASRSYIHIVGSSTVFPLISFTAEEFGRKNRVRVPVVESTGTANGFKLFCSGIGTDSPDVVTASREITAAEKELCKKNKVFDVLEMQIGYDGIVIANSKGTKKLDFSKMDLFLALSSHIARDNFIIIKNLNDFWTDIADNFPDKKIEIYGPARDTGTYDSIINTIFLESCMQLKAFRLKYDDKEELKKACSVIRDDGKFIEIGNDENLIVQKIIRNPHIFGIFGYSFLKNNESTIQSNMINGIEPTYENVANGKYVLSRPLYLYVKKQHFTEIKWLKKFVLEAISEFTIGEKGYLVGQGLIPLSKNDLYLLQAKVKKAL